MLVEVDSYVFNATETSPTEPAFEVVRLWKLEPHGEVVYPKSHPYHKHPYLAQWDSGLYGVYGKTVNVKFLKV